jgi:excisionase family DNA binding protein
VGRLAFLFIFASWHLRILQVPMDDTALLDTLARIERQNLAILAALTPKPAKRFLSVEEAAERLDRSPWTIRQLCLAGQIRAVKGEDKTWRIPSDEVERLEAEGVPKLPKRGSPAQPSAGCASCVVNPCVVESQRRRPDASSQVGKP